MPLTLHNFETTIPASTLKSAKEAFSNDRIRDLTETTTGRWTAYIWSRKYLELFVDLKGNTVTHANCACKQSAGDTYCAHIVAMLYAIQYEQGLIPEREAFVESDPGALGGKWASEEDKDEMARYAKLIREQFNQARDITGHIYKDQTNKVMQLPERLLDEAKKAFKDGKPDEAVNITLAVIETISYCSLMLEHADDAVLDSYYMGFELLGDIVSQSPSEKLQKRLYEHGVSGGIDKKENLPSYHTFWFEFLINNKLCLKQDNRLLDLIDILIRRAKQNRNRNVEPELRDIRDQYLKSLGAKPATPSVAAPTAPATKSNVAAASPTPPTKSNIPATPPTPAQRPTSNGLALQPETPPSQDTPSLVKALEAARKEGNKKRIEMYQQCILSERRSRHDKLGVREIAVELFQNNPTETYLSFIRETYTNVQWSQVGEQYTKQLKKAK